MLASIVFSILSILVESGHSQSTDDFSRDQKREQESSLTYLSTTSSRNEAPLVTGMPLLRNSSAAIGNGMVVYDNATFATSCAYTKSRCADICSWHSEACSRTWADWYRTGLEKSLNTNIWSTYVQTFYDATQSLRVVDGYTYAVGPRTTFNSSTSTVSMINPQLEIVSTLIPRPPCSTPTFSCTQQSWCNTKACTVQGGTVELLFWPPTTSTASGFARNGNLSAVSGPVTAVYKNFTLTSPSVYLEYKTAYALDGCSQTVGRGYPGALLALDPEDLYSIDARNDYYIVTTTIKDQLRTTSWYQSAKLNYNDLTGLPPGPAYQGMPICVASGCGIITPSLFHPQLIVPTHIRGMDPAWATCDLDWRGSWDPPIALTKAASIAVPTTAADQTTMPPASSRPVLDGPAKVTALPDSSMQSSSTTSSDESTSLGQQSSIVEGVWPSFTYLPLSPSSSNPDPPSSSLSDVPELKSTTSSVVRITTIVQVGQGPISNPSTPEHHSAKDATDGSSRDSTTSIPQVTSQQSSLSTANAHSDTSTTEPLPNQPQLTTTIAGQIITAHPDGALELADTTLRAGGSPLTISSAVYSALPGGALVIVSDSPAVPSPTNAYEVLSEALSTMVPHHSNTFVETRSLSLSSNNPPSTSTPTQAPLPYAILSLPSATLTATLHPHSILQIGSLFLPGSNSIVTLDSHTLTRSSNALVFDSTIATFTQPNPTPTILTLDSTLLTAQAGASSGVVVVGSRTLVPGSGALVVEGHTLSAGLSGLVQDGTLVVSTRTNSSVPTSLQTLPGVQASRSTEVRLPSVTTEPTLGSGGAEAAPSDGGADENSSESSADRSRQIRHLPWLGVVIMLLGGTW
jgi:hypothetical protein